MAARARNLNYSPSRSGPRSAPASNNSPFRGSVGTIRRRGTKRTITRAQATIPNTYEEEEGYASGDYDDMQFELAKIRVKVNRVNGNV